MTTEKATLNFRTTKSKKDKVVEIAALRGQEQTDVLNEALDLYFDLYEWQIKCIEKSLAEADAGIFATEEDLEALWKKHGLA